jgi:heme exporter protein A
MIEVRRLVKRFGLKTVLKGMDFSAHEGEFIAVLGPNGTGKTTFLRILASLSRPTMGDVKIAGFSLPHQASAIRKRLGVVSHMPLLYGDLTANENLLFFSRLFGVPSMQERINEVLEQVGLATRRHELVRTFSRGMQQRLAIGRAILHEPDILLFDEPYTGLDQDACDMLDQLLTLVANQGRTVVMTSHDMARVENLASRFDILSRGSISASINKEALGHGNLLDFYRHSLN